jgi:uncharacterized protein (DUF1501 family)
MFASHSHSTRRSFLKSSCIGSAVLTFGGVAPSALIRAAEESQAGRILVVIEMAGGNDGLNTVIPSADEPYKKSRPALAIKPSDVLNIGEGLGFHPELRGFADLLEAGKLAIVQGVGYSDPNRSHFESMDIWHTCQRKNEVRADGWLGRMVESRKNAPGSDPAAIHLGSEKQPFALMSRNVRVPSIRTLEQFRLQGTDDVAFRKAVQELADARRGEDNDLLNFVQSSTSSAISASERLSTSLKSYRSSVNYPENALGQQLKTVAQLIGSGLQTSVYYVQLGGFDTHSQQPAVHAALLGQLGDSVKAFLSDLEQMQHADQVSVMTFSEFGRRVAENASEGTDHGAAGPMFIAGAAVRSGLVGRHPDLNDLEEGDLKHHTDFRRVYATLIEKWFGCDSSAILKAIYEPLELFSDKA